MSRKLPILTFAWVGPSCFSFAVGFWSISPPKAGEPPFVAITNSGVAPKPDPVDSGEVTLSSLMVAIRDCEPTKYRPVVAYGEVEGADFETLARIVAECERTEQADSESKILIASAFERMTELDPERAAPLSLTIQKEALRAEAVAASGRTWLALDPLAALRWHSRQPFHPNLRWFTATVPEAIASLGAAQLKQLGRSLPKYANQVAGVLVVSDGLSAAEQWLDTLPDSRKPGPDERVQLIVRLAESNPEEAVKELDQQLAGYSAEGSAESFPAYLPGNFCCVVYVWAKRDPASAVGWLESQPVSFTRYSATLAATMAWFEQDPNAVWEHVRNLPDEEQMRVLSGGVSFPSTYAWSPFNL
jgi:hypothetical protein